MSPRQAFFIGELSGALGAAMSAWIVAGAGTPRPHWPAWAWITGGLVICFTWLVLNWYGRPE